MKKIDSFVVVNLLNQIFKFVRLHFQTGNFQNTTVDLLLQFLLSFLMLSQNLILLFYPMILLFLLHITFNIYSAFTYIHNWSLQHYLLKPLMLCMIILYVNSGTYNLKSTTSDRFLTIFFMAGLFTLRVFGNNLPLKFFHYPSNTFLINAA